MRLFTIVFLLFFHSKLFCQYTFVPDDNFEQALINLDLDSVIDDYVLTQSIDTVSILYLQNKNISNLTGIENFSALRELFCYSNQITTLNLSNNSQLFEVSCGNNNLEYINLKNGNNQSLWYFSSINNPNLTCIDVNDVLWANYNWAKDSWTNFSLNCNPTILNDMKEKKQLIKITDFFGKDVYPTKNQYLIYYFSDGTVEKKYFLH